MRTGGEALSSSNFDCCPRAARRYCGGDRNACDIVVFIRSSAATLFPVFDTADVPSDVDVNVVSRPSVGTLLLMSADADVGVDVVVVVVDVLVDVDVDVVSGVGTAETFSVLVVVSVDGGGSAALSLCMRPICMRTPRLFLNLLPHTLHVHNSEVCDVDREEVAHVITVSWSVSDAIVENTLELICQFIGGFG